MKKNQIVFMEEITTLEKEKEKLGDIIEINQE